MVSYRWTIYWFDLDPVKGSEQSGKRPVLVISANAVNRALPIVTILPLTSAKPGRKVFSIETLLSPEESGLAKSSIVMAHQIRTISSDRLGKACGEVRSPGRRREILLALAKHLDLPISI
ncbi:type II toxin-antitoxin system PemK/MazF family toxin [bacterium]|nr:type II toxin-antitoxin system PemK/MazF family toxin [bacterium]